MKSYKNLFTASSLLFILIGCSSVTIQPKPITKLTAEPSYEDSRPFYFWGLKGEHRVDVKQICGDKDVLQMQSQQTFEDGALGFVTLGIYAPHSVKVWCADNAVEQLTMAGANNEK